MMTEDSRSQYESAACCKLAMRIFSELCGENFKKNIAEHPKKDGAPSGEAAEIENRILDEKKKARLPLHLLLRGAVFPYEDRVIPTLLSYSTLLSGNDTIDIIPASLYRVLLSIWNYADVSLIPPAVDLKVVEDTLIFSHSFPMKPPRAFKQKETLSSLCKTNGIPASFSTDEDICKISFGFPIIRSEGA